jgi:hypothetical protein
MRDALEAFVAGGGNVAFFSGNVCWWQVRLEAGNRIMVCYKDAAADPLAGIDDTRITVNWADAPVCRPENTLTGVGWRRGAQVDGQGTGYVCRFPQHWVFDGTGLDDGDRFGGALIGYETDACDFVEVDGVPRATGRDGTPPSFVILATADYTGVGGPAPGYATMGVYRRGGTVFTAAATDWGLGLERDPVIATITRNVVTRLSGPRASGTWERIGEAADVVALAAHGGRLFAATRAGRLWQREACGQNLRWAAIGQAPRILALGANGYAKPTQPLTLYAVTDDDRLLSLDPAAGGGWTALDSATGSTAIAVDDDLGVLAVDPAGRLWSWDPAARWTARGPAGLGVRAMAGHYRSLVACSHELGLWRRDIGLRSGWAALGAAVRDLTALAVTEGAIYAAADGTLWRRDLVDGSA